MTSKATEADAPYTLRQIEELLGLGRAAVAALVQAGFVTPQRGARNELRFTFQDVVLLRTAHALRQARVPPRRLLASLRQLRARLPATVPLSGLRIKAVGNEVAVRHGDAPWEVPSGQLLMDFEVAGEPGSVAFLEHPTGASNERVDKRADDRGDGAADESQVFARAEALEAIDPAAAIAAYDAMLQRAPAHADAATNLVALLCAHGRADAAVAVAQRTLQVLPDAPLLWFNLAIALEDLGRGLQALAAYARCLQIDDRQADAHFNAARLNERLGRRQDALRHYSAYRRLSRSSR